MATVATDMPTMASLPAATVSLPWPAGVQSAVVDPRGRLFGQLRPAAPGADRQHDEDHDGVRRAPRPPADPGDDGPDITISADDASNYSTDLGTDQASVPLVAGEVMTERQLLGAMLVHSANDLAYSVASWDAGSLAAFVAKMNAAAAALDMTQTHYADASGYTPQSVSTPADLLKVADGGHGEPDIRGHGCPVVGAAADRGDGVHVHAAACQLRRRARRGRRQVRVHDRGRWRRHPRLPGVDRWPVVHGARRGDLDAGADSARRGRPGRPGRRPGGGRPRRRGLAPAGRHAHRHGDGRRPGRCRSP